MSTKRSPPPAVDTDPEEITPEILARRYDSAVQLSRDVGNGRARRGDLKALREVRDLIAAEFEERSEGRVTEAQRARAFVRVRAWLGLSSRMEREPALAMAIMELRHGWGERSDEDEEEEEVDDETEEEPDA